MWNIQLKNEKEDCYQKYVIEDNNFIEVFSLNMLKKCEMDEYFIIKVIHYYSFKFALFLVEEDDE